MLVSSTRCSAPARAEVASRRPPEVHGLEAGGRGTTQEMSHEDTSWGLYPWFEEHGTGLIHPQDLSAVRALLPNGKVFRLVAEEDGFLRLRYGEAEFRARPPLSRPVVGHIRGVAEAITLWDGRAGQVIGVQWHHQRDEPMYQLRLEGKKKSKRYWNADFADL